MATLVNRRRRNRHMAGRFNEVVVRKKRVKGEISVR